MIGALLQEDASVWQWRCASRRGLSVELFDQLVHPGSLVRPLLRPRSSHRDKLSQLGCCGLKYLVVSEPLGNR